MGYVFCQLLISSTVTTVIILMFFSATLQVASQPAMECLPLVMEPESAFYSDPVVVLDFQSLYPSMIIAYNLCYCTCLGKVFPSKSNVLGVSSYSADPHTIVDLRNQLLLTPNGVLFVQPEVMFSKSALHLCFSY
jgi:DNA polymerase zeta